MNMQRGIFTALVTALGSAGVTGVAVAQTGARPMLEEIIVTSRRYEENLQDAPLAVAVMSSDFIAIQKIETVNEMMRLVPGGTFQEFSKLQPRFSIRGIASATPGSASVEASISLVVDGVPQTRDSMKQPGLYDVERIEVMRGPQGTSFGRNASVGLVHIITKRPTQEFESGVNLTAGTDELFEVDGFFSGPLSDTVSGRVAFNFDTQDGPIESVSTGEGLNGDENFSIRGSLLFEPSDNFTAYLKAEYSQDDDDSPIRTGLTPGCTTPYITIAPGRGGGWGQDWTPSCDPFKAEISTDREFKLERDILSLTAEFVWNVGDGVTVTSLTGFIDGDNDALADVHGSPENLFFQHVMNEVEVFSTELRLDNHATGDAFRWLAGVYLLSDEEFRFEDNQFSFDNPPATSPLLGPTSRQTIATNQTDSVAVFGELSFDLSDEWNLTIGGRFTDDEREQVYAVQAYGDPRFAGPVPGCTAATDPVTGLCGDPANPVGFTDFRMSDSWDNFSAKISLQYDLSDTSMIYALFSQGFLSGGFQHDALNQTQAAIPFDESTVDNFEIGWKADFDRARIAVTVFHIEEEDSQTGGLIPVGTSGAFTSVIQNLGGVETDGIEVEATWLVSDSFLLGGNFAFFDAAASPGTIIIRGTDAMGNPILDDISGNRPNDAPEETAYLFGEYTFNLAGGSSLALRADYQHRSDSWSNTANRDTRPYLQPKLNDVGARVTWVSASGDTRVMLWGKNLREDWDILTTGPGFLAFQFPQAAGGKTSYGVTASFTF